MRTTLFLLVAVPVLLAGSRLESGVRMVLQDIPASAKNSAGPTCKQSIGNSAEGGWYGRESLIIDGTASGPRMVTEGVPGRRGSFPGRLTHLGNLLLFAAYRPNIYDQLWVSDGSDQGTHILKDFRALGWTTSIPYETTVAARLLFFAVWELGPK